MERVTSKTLDCFVEFIDLGEAASAVTRFEQNRQGGRGRLGQRHVDVELSTQDQLMKELFPKAKNVQWEGCRPHIIPRDPNDPYNSGFQGFIIKEELIMLLKHVESPQRVSRPNFSQIQLANFEDSIFQGLSSAFVRVFDQHPGQGESSFLPSRKVCHFY
jgi:hypothetical protein